MDDTATDASDRLRDGNRQPEQEIRRLCDECSNDPVAAG